MASEAPEINDGRSAGRSADAGSRASAFRFRELTLVPAIVLAIIAGALISDAFLTTRQLPEHPAAVVRAVGAGDRAVADPDRRQVRPVAGIDRRRCAPMLAAWLIVSDTTFGGSGVGLNV